MSYSQTPAATPRATNAGISQQIAPRNRRPSIQDSPARAPSTASTQIRPAWGSNARSPRPGTRYPLTTNTTGRRRDNTGPSIFSNLQEAEVSGSVFVNTPGPVHFYQEGVSSPQPNDNDVGSEVSIHPTHDCSSATATLGPFEHSEYEIYCKYLLVKKRGIPLWVPGPMMMFPYEYRRNGTSIGDVGILNLTTGDFTFLFNIFLPSDHEINEGRVPNGFIPLDKSRAERTMKRCIIPDRCLASSTLRRTDSFEFSFQTTARDGAVLVMPDGGLSEDLQNLRLVDKYIAANIKSWWEYVESDDCGVQTENGIQVVIGTDKVPSWGMATFENVEGPMHFEFEHDRTASQTQTPTWKRINGRAGPTEGEMWDLLMGTNATPLCNQCVFVRTLNVSLSSKGRVELVAHEVCTRGQRNINIQTSKAGPPVSHPSKLLNKCLLEKCPNAEVVITKDSDWISVITENDTTIPSNEEICARVLASHLICGREGVVTLTKREEVFSTGSILRLGEIAHNQAGFEDVVSVSNESDPFIIGHLLLETPDDRPIVTGPSGSVGYDQRSNLGGEGGNDIPCNDEFEDPSDSKDAEQFWQSFPETKNDLDNNRPQRSEDLQRLKDENNLDIELTKAMLAYAATDTCASMTPPFTHSTLLLGPSIEDATTQREFYGLRSKGNITVGVVEPPADAGSLGTTCQEEQTMKERLKGQALEEMSQKIFAVEQETSILESPPILAPKTLRKNKSMSKFPESTDRRAIVATTELPRTTLTSRITIPTVTNNVNTNVLATERHPKYYINGADLYVLVKTTMFRIHSYFFVRESTTFHRKVNPVSQGIPPEGLTEGAPILLEDISPEDFEIFLWVFYNPRYSTYKAPVEHWKVILKLANSWGFKEIKELAVRELQQKPQLDLVDRLALYEDHKVDSWHLIPLYGLLCARDYPLTIKESKILGLDTTVLIAAVREQVRAALPSNQGKMPKGLQMPDIYKAFERKLNLEEGTTLKFCSDNDVSLPMVNTTTSSVPNGNHGEAVRFKQKK